MQAKEKEIKKLTYNNGYKCILMLEEKLFFIPRNLKHLNSEVYPQGVSVSCVNSRTKQYSSPPNSVDQMSL